MKKIISLFTIIILLFIITACKTDEKIPEHILVYFEELNENLEKIESLINIWENDIYAYIDADRSDFVLLLDQIENSMERIDVLSVRTKVTYEERDSIWRKGMSTVRLYINLYFRYHLLSLSSDGRDLFDDWYYRFNEFVSQAYSGFDATSYNELNYCRIDSEFGSKFDYFRRELLWIFRIWGSSDLSSLEEFRLLTNWMNVNQYI